MRLPLLASGVEQPDQLVGSRIDCGEVRPLKLVAAVTGQGQIFEGVVTAVLAWFDMLNLESQKGDIVLVNVAIFTAVVRSLANSLA